MEALQISRVALTRIVPDPANARSHNAANLDAIEASLRRFGQAEPLVVQAGTLRLIAGHGRLEAMRKLGWTEADVVELEVEGIDAAALSIALNRTAELADWDEPALARILAALQDEDALLGTGYTDGEVATLLAAARAAERQGLVDPDAIPEPPETATTRTGDLWVLGEHRLLCGDSSLPADLDRLLGGARVQLLNTDPPYNVRVEPRSNNAIAAGLSSFAGTTHHQKLDVERDPSKAQGTTKRMRAKDRPLANDFVSDEKFCELLRAWFGNAARALEPGRAFYIWGGYANVANYPAALEEAGLYFSQSVIWDKQHPVLTRKDMMGAHEWCFYGWREGAAHHWYGPNNATDLWAIKKVTPTAMVHLTEKPVELAERAMAYSTQAGENVLDLFGGSGSTLIAAERTGRRAFLMELDGPYCDVILERYAAFSGVPPTLDGKTFEQVRAERVGASTGDA